MSKVVEQIQHSIPPATKPILDVLAIAGWIGALAGALTNVFGLLAAIASFAWCAIRVYETKTVQNWLNRKKGKH
jgi:hypothetical protein